MILQSTGSEEIVRDNVCIYVREREFKIQKDRKKDQDDRQTDQDDGQTD